MGRRLIGLVVISLIVMEVYAGQDVVLDNGIEVNEDVAGNGTGENGTAPFEGETTGNSITLNGAKVTGGYSVYGARVKVDDK
jgi:hypothetical protein